ncbi:MAG: InlB B-repeat-containing protein, partial [Firmicutes bacterium]|nr:InlB B-repeat-containing protein [Bacillota bacterium]
MNKNRHRHRLYAFVLAGVFVFCAIVAGVAAVEGNNRAEANVSFSTRQIGTTSWWGTDNYNLNAVSSSIQNMGGGNSRLVIQTPAGSIAMAAKVHTTLGFPVTVTSPVTHSPVVTWTSANFPFALHEVTRVDIMVSSTRHFFQMRQGAASPAFPGVDITNWPVFVVGIGNQPISASPAPFRNNIGNSNAPNFRQSGAVAQSGTFRGWSTDPFATSAAQLLPNQNLNVAILNSSGNVWAIFSPSWPFNPNIIRVTVPFHRQDTGAFIANITMDVNRNTNQTFTLTNPPAPPANHQWTGLSTTRNVGNVNNATLARQYIVAERIQRTITWQTGATDATWTNALPAGVSGGAMNTSTNRTSTEGQGLTPADNRPGTLSRPGWAFAGWSPSGAVPASNQIRTAQWTLVSHTVTWNPNGGTWTDLGHGNNRTSAHGPGSTPVPPLQPVRPGFQFLGWSPAITAVTGPRTHTAMWQGFGIIVHPPLTPPENWEYGWNILRLHFAQGNAAGGFLPGFSVHEYNSTATRFYDPEVASSLVLPTVAQMNNWAATQPGFEDKNFLGWYTNPDWNIAQHQRVTQIPANLTGVVRYYARWGHEWVLTSVRAAGGNSSHAITANNEILAWGSNLSGQLGLGGESLTQRVRPERMGDRTDWAMVSSGGTTASGFTHAITTNGELWAWGNNSSGQLGDGTTIDRPQPVRIGERTDWAQVDAGHFSLAITTGGELWALGRGIMAMGGYNYSPIRIGERTDWVQVAGGMALSANGELWGFLVQGGFSNNMFRRFGTASNWAYVAAGHHGVYAITTTGQLWNWGASTGSVIASNAEAS